MIKYKKGRMHWVPREVLNEVDIIKHREGLKKKSDAMKAMVGYAKVGVEIDKLNPLSKNKFKRRVK